MTDDRWPELRARVLRFLAHLGLREAEREDVAAKALLIVFERWREGRLAGDPLPFALGVAWKLRFARARSAPDSLAEPEALLCPRTGSGLREAELRDWIEAALARLRAEERALLHLRYGEDQSERAIGAILGLPRGTVARRLHEARGALRDALRRLGCGAELSVALCAWRGLGSAPAVPALAAGGLCAVAGGAFLWKSAVLVLALAVLCGTAFLYLAESPELSHGAPEGTRSQEAMASAPHGGAAREQRVGDGGPGPLAADEFAAPSADTALHSGVLRDASGRPIPGALVRAWPRDWPRELLPVDLRVQRVGQRVRTDPEGRWTLPLPNAERAALAFEAPGYGFAFLDRAASAAPREDRLEADRPITGRVVDAAGAAISGVTVRLEWTVARARFLREALTGADGQFALYGLPSAQANLAAYVRFRHPHFAPRLQELSDFDRTEPAEITLCRGQTIQGVVRASGQPVPGALVSVWALGHAPISELIEYPAQHGVTPPAGPEHRRIIAQAQTDAEGRYRLDGIPIARDGAMPTDAMRVAFVQGEPERGLQLGGIVATHADFAPVAHKLALATEEGLSLERDFDLPAKRSLRGQVVGRWGRPLPGVRVRVTPLRPGDEPGRPFDELHEVRDFVQGLPAPLGAWVETDAEGHFEHAWIPVFADLLGYELTLCACKIGGVQQYVALDRAVPDELERPIALPLVRHEVRLVDEAGAPLSAVRFTVRSVMGGPTDPHPLQPLRYGGLHVQTATDTSGLATIYDSVLGMEESPPPATYAFAVPGRPRVLATLDPNAAETTVRCAPGLGLGGVLLPPPGSSATGEAPRVRLDLVQAQEPARRVATHASVPGDFHFGGLVPGTYEIWMQVGAERHLLHTGPAGEERLRLQATTLPPETSVALTPFRVAILDSLSRTPIRGAMARLHAGPQAGALDGKSTAPGKVHFRAVASGPYRIEVLVPGRPAIWREISITPETATQEVLVEPELGLFGEVRWPAGRERSQGAKVALREFHAQSLIAETETDANGWYRFEGVKPGRYALSAEALAVGEDDPSTACLTPVATWIDLRARSPHDPPARVDLQLQGLVPITISLKPGQLATWTSTDRHGLQLRVLDESSAVLKVLPGSGSGALSRLLWTQEAEVTLPLPPGRYQFELRYRGRIVSATEAHAPGQVVLPLEP